MGFCCCCFCFVLFSSTLSPKLSSPFVHTVARVFCRIKTVISFLIKIVQIHLQGKISSTCHLLDFSSAVNSRFLLTLREQNIHFSNRKTNSSIFLCAFPWDPPWPPEYQPPLPLPLPTAAPEKYTVAKILQVLEASLGYQRPMKTPSQQRTNQTELVSSISAVSRPGQEGTTGRPARKLVFTKTRICQCLDPVPPELWDKNCCCLWALMCGTSQNSSLGENTLQKV